MDVIIGREMVHPLMWELPPMEGVEKVVDFGGYNEMRNVGFHRGAVQVLCGEIEGCRQIVSVLVPGQVGRIEDLAGRVSSVRNSVIEGGIVWVGVRESSLLGRVFTIAIPAHEEKAVAAVLNGASRGASPTDDLASFNFELDEEGEEKFNRSGSSPYAEKLMPRSDIYRTMGFLSSPEAVLVSSSIREEKCVERIKYLVHDRVNPMENIWPLIDALKKIVLALREIPGIVIGLNNESDLGDAFMIVVPKGQEGAVCEILEKENSILLNGIPREHQDGVRGESWDAGETDSWARFCFGLDQIGVAKFNESLERERLVDTVSELIRGKVSPENNEDPLREAIVGIVLAVQGSVKGKVRIEVNEVAFAIILDASEQENLLKSQPFIDAWNGLPKEHNDGKIGMPWIGVADPLLGTQEVRICIGLNSCS